MKKLLRYMLCALAGAAALGLTACNDSDDTPPGEDPVVVPPPEAIGTYSFDGTKGDKMCIRDRGSGTRSVRAVR